MDTYFGQISIRNDYVNFRPMYLYENGRFDFLNSEELSYRFPETNKGEINFTCVGRYEEKNFKDHELIFLDIEDGALEDNVGAGGMRNRTGYKIEVSKTEKKRVHTLESQGYYCILSANDFEGDYQKSPALTILNDNVYAGLQVLIETKDPNVFLGPFEVIKSSFGNERLTVLLQNKDQKQIYKAVQFPSNAEIQNLGWRGAQLCFANIEDGVRFSLDYSTDEQILSSFLSSVKAEHFENGKLDLATAGSLLESHKNSLFVDVPDDIRNKRFARLEKIITDEQNLNTNASNISSLFCAFLEQSKDNDQYNHLIEELVEKPEFREKIQRFKIVQEKIDTEQQKLQKLHEQCEAIQKEIDAKESEKADALLEDKKQEVALLSQKREALKKDIDDLEEIHDLNNRTKKLKADFEYEERRRNDLDHQLREVKKSFGTFFEESAERVVKFTFDGMLANQLTDIAANWKKSDESKQYKEIVNILKEAPHLEKDGKDLADYLVGKIQESRPNYSKNTILNILICYAQGFLTVFSGEPGTGKTSICNILANALGLNSIKENNPACSRFIPVSVERGWTTKRDFVGYFNPLTKTFDQNNRKVFDALNVLNIEALDAVGSDTPFAILLDEANLSPMEYYWADFMNVCDDFDSEKNINLGGDYILKIAKCMRFLATINNDHTTESMSPRLIDRAWVIRLPESRNTSPIDTNVDCHNPFVSWNNFYKVFCNHYDKTKIDGVAGDIFDEMLKKCKDAKINISPRVIKAISRYWFTAQALFEESTETDASIAALDFAVAQRILPHINGNGQIYKEKLEKIQEFCNQKNLQMSSGILKDIIQKGIESMQYFQYFA